MRLLLKAISFEIGYGTKVGFAPIHTRLPALLDEFEKGRRAQCGELILELREGLQVRCLPGSPSLVECACTGTARVMPTDATART